MIRITFRHDNDEHLDAKSWATRVRDAAPIGLHLAEAYVDAKYLVVYVEADADEMIEEFADRLGLPQCARLVVDPLPIGDASSIAELSSGAELTDLRTIPIVETTTLSTDDRAIVIHVRHKPYEHIDHVDVKETDSSVEVTVWVGSPADDDRRHYVSLGQTLSTATITLESPLGTRRVIEDQ
jgi:hypothetical protein